MARKALFMLFILVSIVVSVSCSSKQASPTPVADMPNPASVYCEEHGGKVDLRQDASGGVAGICVFPDASECDEWAYLRGECQPGGTPQASPTPDVNMPNPASVYCEEHGGKVDLRQDASGGVAGICVFADGSECDEWAYFRGECKPGGTPAVVESTPTVVPEPTPTAVAELAGDGWRTYRNETLGYSFQYPAEAEIITADDPLQSLTVYGPGLGDEFWAISHPRDREEYRPPRVWICPSG